jgi:hypothetical protein
MPRTPPNQLIAACLVSKLKSIRAGDGDGDYNFTPVVIRPTREYAVEDLTEDYDLVYAVEPGEEVLAEGTSDEVAHITEFWLTASHVWRKSDENPHSPTVDEGQNVKDRIIDDVLRLFELDYNLNACGFVGSQGFSVINAHVTDIDRRISVLPKPFLVVVFRVEVEWDRIRIRA